jgi:hypothetical protein
MLNINVKCVKNEDKYGKDGKASVFFDVGKVYKVRNGLLYYKSGKPYTSHKFNSLSDINQYFKDNKKAVEFALSV